MIKIDFNRNFRGFSNEEKILLDTGIILALANEYDAWHNTVNNLFETHILSDEDDENSKAIFLFVNPLIINEVTHLAGRPLESYRRKKPKEDFSNINPEKVVDETISNIEELIDNEVFLVIDGNREAVMEQFKLYKDLGSADAANVAIANQHSLNFLTVDSRLAENIYLKRNQLTNIHKVYTTSGKYRTY